MMDKERLLIFKEHIDDQRSTADDEHTGQGVDGDELLVDLLVHTHPTKINQNN